VKHEGGSVMVWWCFSGTVVGPFHRIHGIMDRFVYKDIFEGAEEEMPLRWIFQQDNDPKHFYKVVKLWFAEKKCP